MELAVATHTPVLGWLAALDEDPRLVATAVDVVNRNANRKGGPG